VDLDFEPRFVTKDKSGIVVVWKRKPAPYEECDSWVLENSLAHEFVILNKLKLAEFTGKDWWTECIYEVPRKTTGKVKHIERIDDSFVDKINAIIDAVNELKGE
jgi:hypothetical protein